MSRAVEVKYRADLNRQLKLVDIRLEGTDEFRIDEVQSVLDSKEANALGIIPFIGFGRGYTSAEIIESDRLTIKSLLRELGFRRNEVTVRQGVSPKKEFRRGLTALTLLAIHLFPTMFCKPNCRT
jgi:vacuolar-type H+-ATPase subunit I/STV1